jgi:hypothetical protein
MPAKSSAQRRWAFAVKGAAWARKHHFDTPGKLPAKVGTTKGTKGTKKGKKAKAAKAKRKGK